MPTLGTPGVQDFTLVVPGRGVTHWRRGPLIGTGSFGKVYSALDAVSGESIAVKVVRLAHAPSLQREVEALTLLPPHPNVIRYLGTSRTPTKQIVFFEYASGGSLARMVSEYGPLESQGVRRFTRHIVCGLAHLHHHRVMHRDVKGGNVLVDRGVAKLGDFGCSKPAPSEEGYHTLVGTTQYAAPEVVRGVEYGTPADIWSLGQVVLEMMTGRPAWPNPALAMYQLCSTEHVPAPPPGASEECIDFLQRCFQRDPGARATAAQLLEHPFVGLGVDGSDPS